MARMHILRVARLEVVPKTGSQYTQFYSYLTNRMISLRLDQEHAQKSVSIGSLSIRIIHQDDSPIAKGGAKAECTTMDTRSSSASTVCVESLYLGPWPVGVGAHVVRD